MLSCIFFLRQGIFFAKPLEKDHNKYYNICGKGSLAEPIINLRKKDLYVRYQDRTYHYSKGKTG